MLLELNSGFTPRFRRQGAQNFVNRKENMLGLYALLSLTLTAILVVIGFSLRLTKKKVEKPADPNTSTDPKTQDESTDIWYWLGFDDDAPNVYRAVSSGWSGKGTILQYLLYGYDCSIDYNVDRTVYPNGKFVKTPIVGGRYKDEDNFDYWIRMNFGKRRYGWPIIRSLVWLSIDRVVPVEAQEVQENIRDAKVNVPEVLTGLKASTVRRKGLYEEITRPTRHEDIDTKDGVRFTANSTLILKIDDPRPAFNKYRDSLLQNISLVVSSFLSSFTIRKDWSEYKSAGERGHKFTEAELGDLEKLLIPFGGEVTQFTMSDPELAPKIQEKFDERATATVSAETTHINADAARYKKEQEGKGDASYTLRTGTAEAMVIKQKAKAMAERLNEYVNAYKARGASDQDALQAATEMLKTQFGAEAVGNLKGTWAPGKEGGILFAASGTRE